jgi:hypothetical protein
MHSVTQIFIASPALMALQTFFRNAWSRARYRLSIGGFAHHHRSALDHRLSRVTSPEQAWGRHQVGNRTVLIGMRLEKFFDPSTVF